MVSVIFLLSGFETLDTAEREVEIGKILVVIPQFGSASDLCASLSSSLKSCGLTPEVVSEEVLLGETYACVVYVGSEYEVSSERV